MVESPTRKSIEARSKASILYFHKDPSVHVPESLSEPFIHIDIPRYCIYGIQTPWEYSREKRKSAEKTYEELGDDFLQRQPILAFALPVPWYDEDRHDEIVPETCYSVVLIDGHHRTRYAPSSIRNLQGNILTVNQAARAYQNDFGFRGDRASFIETFVAWKNDTLNAFTRIKDSLAPCDVTFGFSETGDAQITPILREGPFTFFQRRV